MIAHFTRRGIAAVLALVCAVALAACTGGTKIELVPSASSTPSASADATNRATEAFPNRGNVIGVTRKKGKVECSSAKPLVVEFGKTIQVGDVTVNAMGTRAPDGVLVTFSPSNDIYSAAIVNGREVASLDDGVDGLYSKVLFSNENFAKDAEPGADVGIETIVLCAEDGA